VRQKQKDGSEKYFHVMEFFRNSGVDGYIQLSIVLLLLLIGIVYWLFTLV
jgi:hypothetical protein